MGSCPNIYQNRVQLQNLRLVKSKILANTIQLCLIQHQFSGKHLRNCGRSYAKNICQFCHTDIRFLQISSQDLTEFNS